jgi:hypothetical protein
MKLTYEIAKIFFNYDDSTGILTRNHVDAKWYKVASTCKRDNSMYAGKEAGFLETDRHGKKYRKVKFKGTAFFVHRIIWLIKTGSMPSKEIDNINGNGLDNRWVNLREVSHKTNGMNMNKSKANKSGFTGVSFSKAKNKWVAQIRANGKQTYLGAYASLSEAIAARKAANIIHGYHVNHGV